MPEAHPEVAAARAELAAAPDGRLGLPARRAVHDAELGVLDGPDHEHPARRRRAALWAACARRALPVWEARHPHDRRVATLLAEIEDTLRSGSPEQATSIGMDGLELLETLAEEAEDPQEDFWAAGATCAAAILLPRGDLSPLLGTDARDDELEVTDRDPGWFAQEACGDDAGARSAFWTWYLDEAVPMARAAA